MDINFKDGTNAVGQAEPLRLELDRCRRELDECRQQRRQLENLVADVADPIFVMAPDGQITDVNPAGSALLGHEKSKMLGRPLGDFVSGASREEFLGWVGALAPGAPRLAQLACRCPSGEEKIVDFRLARSQDGDKIIVSGRDVTELKRTEAVLRSSAKIAHGLIAIRADVGAALSKPVTTREMLRECAQAVVDDLEASFARIWTLNHRDNVLELQASAGIYTRLDGTHSRIPVGSLKVGLIAREQKPYLTNDVLNDPRIGDKEWARRCGLVAFAGYPLLVEGRLVGVVALFARHPLSEAALVTLESVAGAIAQGIDRKRVEDELRHIEFYLSEGQRLSHTGSWAWNVATKRNVFWSKEHFRIYGMDPETSVGDYQTARDRIHPEDGPMFDAVLDRAIQERKDFQMHHRLVLPGGMIRHVHTLGHPVLNEANELVEFIGTAIDVTEQYRARAALEEAFSKIKQSEARLRTIIDAIPTLVWSTAADGSVEFVNLRWRQYTGLSTPEAQGRGWRAAIHPDDAGWMLPQWETIMQSAQSGELEARLRRFDGEYRWFIFRAEPLLDEHGQIIKWYGTNTDIDDRRRAEEALRASEQNLRLIVDTIPGLVHTMTAAGEVEYINQQLLDYFGQTREELKDWASNETLHPDERSFVIARWTHSVETGLPFEVEHRVRRADGAYRWFHSCGLPLKDKEGRIIRWYNLLTDIDDRKRAEENLRAREHELRLIAESIPGMIVVNTPAGELEYATQRLLDFVGRELTELKALRWTRIVHPEDAGSLVNQWLYSVKTGQPLEVVYRMRRFDGTYRWFHSRVEPLLDKQGRILRWYGLLVDVDDQKNAEEALRTSQAELAHVSRLTTIGELTASIAHEVNQPLTAVVNNANVCLGLLPDDTVNLGEVREALTDIIGDAERASTVIARVRQLARKAPMERAPLNLEDVVNDVLTLARHESAARRVIIHTDLSANLPPVLGDRVQLQQVLLNLIVNGMDAMNNVEESKRIMVIGNGCETQAGNSRVVLRVRDAGAGFKAGEMDRLFEPFFTTKPQGMGMGLAISRSIIEAHGGRLWAEPNPGSGATFLFSLPAAGTFAS